MNLKELLDGFIEDAVAHGYSSEQSTYLLLDEDFYLFCEDIGRAELLETVRRVRRRVGGINVTMRKVGRPNPLRSQRAKRAARAHKASRAAANRRFQRSPKARQMRRVMARVRKTKARPARPRRAKAYRGHHGAVRHAGPRRATRPRVRRARRPSYRRRR